ncbi:hypothetical protein M885DRAFT_514684 [Pelagophyceae sp. CCMP2097]|nr:hypothetical protein M885DRAFT_514684 [Pelagophyceae sp. CCMP2097]
MASLVPIADDAPASSMDLLGSYGSDSEGGTPVGGAEYDPMAATFDADAEPAAKRQELSAEAFAARPLVVLPPEPAGPADAALTARLAGWRARGYNPTQQIRQNREFANPQILQKVVEYFEIDDVASNYPTDMFDPQAIQARRKDKSASKTEASTTPPPPGDVAAP